jgi:hypothetical protein
MARGGTYFALIFNELWNQRASAIPVGTPLAL